MFTDLINLKKFCLPIKMEQQKNAKNVFEILEKVHKGVKTKFELPIHTPQFNFISYWAKILHLMSF